MRIQLNKSGRVSPNSSAGGAIGTAGWQRAIARKLAQLALPVGLAAPEAFALNECRWREELDRAMRDAGKSAADIASDLKGGRWKIEFAARDEQWRRPPAGLRQEPNMGTPLAVRVNVCPQANR